MRTVVVVVVLALAGAALVVALSSGDDRSQEASVQAADTTSPGAEAAPPQTTTATSAPAPGAAGDAAAATTTTTGTTATTGPTTTSAARSSSTSSAPTTTTTTRPRTGTAPEVAIVSPGALTRFAASYDPTAGRFLADVPLSARVSDPDGDAVTVEWFSDIDGFLGSGDDIVARLQPQGDASQPVVTVRVTDSTGAVTEATITLIVWIHSDQ